jgi:LPXTG-site transpeptidase (sortase) family protein
VTTRPLILFITMNTRFNITVGILFILAGSLLGSSYIFQYFQNSSVNATPKLPASLVTTKSTTTVTSTVPMRTALPTHISVPATGVNVDIDPGYYDKKTQTWTLSDTKAYFATVSTVPNTVGGGTYIYGHNRASVFAHLNGMKDGDEAYVTTSDGKVFTYSLIDIEDVTPTNLSLLQYSGKPTLILQTCAGFLDEYRRLFILKLVSES